MAELVKVAHTKKVNAKVFSAYGMIEIDQNGCADVPPEMAKKIEVGDYGEAWRLLKPVKKESVKVETKTKSTEAPKVAEAETPPPRKRKVRRRKTRKPTL